MSQTPNSRAEERRKSYKVVVDAVAGRRKREETLIEIRKIKKEDNLLKKRREGMQVDEEIQLLDIETELESLPAMVAGVFSDDLDLQLEATSQIRNLLAFEEYPPIDEVVNAGVVPRFVEFLTWHNVPLLQFFAAWALSNIVSGTSEHARVVIEYGAVPNFVQLLRSPNATVQEQAVWALANIAGDNANFRDLVLSHGALMPILAQLNADTTPSMLRNASWAVSNFCNNKPQAPSFEQIKPALTALEHLILSDDEEVLTNSCCALSHLADGTNGKIQAVIEAGVCRRIVELLLHKSPTILYSALQVVSNIVSGDDVQTQIMIDNQVLPCLFTLLTENHLKSIHKHTCWAISNITAGNKKQIQAVIDANIIPTLTQLFQTAEFNIRKQAAWAISNALSGGSHKQIKYLVNKGCIEPLCEMLVCGHPELVAVCLEGLENILEVGEAEKELGNNADVNIYAQRIDDAQGFDRMENLQNNDNREICEEAVKILETYRPDDDEDYYDIAPAGLDGQPDCNFDSNQPQIPPGGFTFS